MLNMNNFDFRSWKEKALGGDRTCFVSFRFAKDSTDGLNKPQNIPVRFKDVKP